MAAMILPRRDFLAGLASALAAPAIVRAASLMPVKAPAIAADDGLWMRGIVQNYYPGSLTVLVTEGANPGDTWSVSCAGGSDFIKIGRTIMFQPADHFTIAPE